MTKANKRAHEGGGESHKMRPGKGRRRAKKVAAEEEEERRLTNLLFGGAAPTHDISAAESGIAEQSADILEFEIDRTGDGAAEVDTGKVGDVEEEKDLTLPTSNPDRVEPDEDEEEDSEKPAWVDEDDEKVEVNLFQTSRLRKLRQTREEPSAAALKGVDFTERLRERYKSTMQRTARTDWATVDEDNIDLGEADKEVDGKDASQEDSPDGPLLRESSRRLAPNLLSVVRCRDANQSDPNSAVVQAVHFHPGSEPDRPLMLTAGLDKTLRFFQVGAEESVKVHGIHFPKMPIYSAQFVGKSGNVLVSGRRPFFYLYDAVAGKLDQIPRILGRAEKSWEKSVASPDGRTVAFCGNDGYVVLFDIVTKQTRAELKLNGSVRCIAFSGDGEHVIASGSDGDVYRWDLRSTKCVERFANQDGTISSSLAVSSRHVAVGAESGVVNLFSGGTGRAKKPLKSIMNLHTSADALRFNHDGQILAMSTRRDKQTLKLVHVPSATVFSNWPTSKTPLGSVWSMDFSPESKFLAIGNDKGKCLLYSLDHYSRKV